MAIPSSWGAARSPEPPKGRSLTVWIIAIAILLLIAGGVLVYYLYLRPQNVNVGLQFGKPDQVLVGQPFTLTISGSNYSNAILSNVKFSLLLPDGMAFLGQSPGTRLREEIVGDLGPGSLAQKSFNLIVLDGTQSIKHLQAKLVYATSPNGTTEYESDGAVDIAVGQPAISLSYTIPQNVFSGQEFSFTVQYANNGQSDAANLGIMLNYPPAFQFEKADPRPDNGNNAWDVPSLGVGASGTITVTGVLLGQQQSSFPFSGTVNQSFLGQTYSVQTQSANIGITNAPLSLEITLGNGSMSVITPGASLNYTLSYKNNSSVGMQNVIIDAKLSGEMLDTGALRTDGSFNSLTNTVEWLAANTPALSYVPPGGSGTVIFSISAKSTYPIRRVGDKNYSIRVDGTIQSPTVPDQTTAARTISVASLETKVSGTIAAQANALFRDAASNIVNSGPYPPHVNQATEYSVHWILKNYATDVSNVQVSAYLESGTTFVGVVKSNVDTEPSYNPSSGQITWTIPFIPATKGVIGDPVEAVFQIQNTPAVNQLGQNKIEMMTQTTVQAQDNYAGGTINASAPPVATDLPNDPTVQGVDTRVQQ